MVLSDSKERVYSTDEGVEEIPLGLYLVKGDMMYVQTLLWCADTDLTDYSVLIGEVDEAIDDAADLSTIRADPLPPIRY